MLSQGIASWLAVFAGTAEVLAQSVRHLGRDGAPSGWVMAMRTDRVVGDTTMRQRKLRDVAPAALILGLVLGLAPEAGARKPSGEAQAAIQSHTITLQQLGERDERRVATSEIGMARGWLGEAQSYIDNRRKRDQLGWALARLDAVMPLIEALLARAEAEEVALAAVTRAEAKEAEVQARQAEVEQLRRRRAVIEKEVGR